MRAEVKSSGEAAELVPSADSKPQKNNVRRVTIAVFALCGLLFTYSLIADRLTPYTDQATVQAYIVNMAPDVSGHVKLVYVIDNQAVRAGDVLFEIDSDRYAIEIKLAEAQLAAAGLNVGASTAALASAQARLAQAKAKLTQAETQAARMLDLVKQGIESRSRGELAQEELDTSSAEVARAVAEVEQARQNLGPLGEDNPQIRQAMATLERAKRDLIDTIVKAPSDGVITNLQLAGGQFVATGQSVMTFVESEAIWIESQFSENSLEYLKPNNRAEVVLDVHPGRVYQAEVESVGWGVDSREINPATGLQKVRNDKGWIREKQRFIVRVRFDPGARPRGVRIGSQANVVVYSGKSYVTDAIGKIWIRLIAYLNYLS